MAKRKQLVIDTIRTESPYILDGVSLADAVKYMEKLKDEFAGRDVYFFLKWEYDDIQFHLCERRLETDKEYAKRTKKHKADKKTQEENEYKQYLKLKEKFGE